MAIVFETARGRLYGGDCIDVLSTVERASVDLGFADPPLHFGKHYGKSISDALADDQYLEWCRAWIAACVAVLKDGGAFYLYNLPKWNVELGHYLREEGMTFRHWIAIDIKMSLPI